VATPPSIGNGIECAEGSDVNDIAFSGQVSSAEEQAPAVSASGELAKPV